MESVEINVMEEEIKEEVKDYTQKTWCDFCYNRVDGECTVGEDMSKVPKFSENSENDCEQLRFI